jgi:glycosyltransferase involved in cell wall biosynthesis
MGFDHAKIDKKISVIIPVYNGRKYIEKAIHSVAIQTLHPYEIIVVDDGSTDDSALMLAELAKEYPIKLLKKENGGQSSARNYGVRVSTGDLIAFLDQDDIWYPNHLEELIKPFLENIYPETGWVYSSVDEIGDNDELYRMDCLSVGNSIHPKKTISQCLSADMFVIPSATIVSKKAFDDVGGFDERLSGYEDDDLFLNIFWKGYGNIFINKSLAQWRIHDKSCSWSKRMAISRIIYAKKLLESFQNNYIRGCNYQTDVILPRFINIIIGEYKKGILFNNKDYSNLMYDSLHELYPYMHYKMKLNCSIILFVQKHQLLKSILKPFVKIYRFLSNIDHYGISVRKD